MRLLAFTYALTSVVIVAVLWFLSILYFDITNVDITFLGGVALGGLAYFIGMLLYVRTRRG